MDAVESYDHCGVPVEIFYDEMAENPYTSFDNAYRLIGTHWLNRNYGLGLEDLPCDDRNSNTIVRYLKLFHDCVVVVPFEFQDYGSGGNRVFLTTPDDSPATGGYAVIDRETLAREWNSIEQAETYLEAAFKEFAAYCEGDVYGYVAGGEASDADSCWGFYGYDYAKQCADEAAEYLASERARLRALPWLPTFGNPIQEVAQ